MHIYIFSVQHQCLSLFNRHWTAYTLPPPPPPPPPCIAVLYYAIVSILSITIRQGGEGGGGACPYKSGLDQRPRLVHRSPGLWSALAGVPTARGWECNTEHRLVEYSCPLPPQLLPISQPAAYAQCSVLGVKMHANLGNY